MSRFFDGTADEMVFPSSDFQFGSIVMVVKLVAGGTWKSMLEFKNSSAVDVGAFLRHSGGQLSWNNASTNLTAVSFGSGDGWCVIATTKATGTVAANNYKIPIGGSTTTAATGTGANMFTSSGGTMRLGGNNDFCSMYLAAVGIWNSTVLSQADIEGIASAKTTAAMDALNPTCLYDDSDAFATNLTNPGTFDRSSDTGTADDADDPSGWVYGIGGSTDYTATVPGAGAATASGPQPMVSTLTRPYVLTTIS